jgi:pimeloyl-ACP methyl ester carboxylesterase
VLQTQLLELTDCGHSPHKDQTQALIDAATRFIRSQDRS